jgi:hypothetical protein
MKLLWKHLDKLVAVVGIAEVLDRIWTSYVERKRAREEDDKDRKIRELEAKLAEYEAEEVEEKVK